MLISKYELIGDDYGWYSLREICYHRSRNWEGQGGLAPQYINQGGPGPPNVGAIKGILTVKMDLFIHNRAIGAKKN